jgi:hypothetical protein
MRMLSVVKCAQGIGLEGMRIMNESTYAVEEKISTGAENY